MKSLAFEIYPEKYGQEVDEAMKIAAFLGRVDLLRSFIHGHSHLK